MFRYRAKLFEIIIKELPYEKNYFIEEYYSEGNDFSVHRMIVSTSKFGMEASINYKGKIKIEKVKLKPIMQVLNSKNCCPYTKEELENYDGHLPLKCITSIGVKKEATEFRTQISLN